MLRLVTFLAIFLSVYGAMHFLVFLGIRPLLSVRRRSRLLLLAWMALMVAAPILVRAMERFDLEASARALALLSYSWMGFVFITFAGFVAVFSWDLCLQALSRFFPELSAWSLQGARCAVLVPTLALLLCIYGLCEANRLTVETIHIKTDKLPPGAQRLRIVQISDLHLGLINRHDKLEQVVQQIVELAPDLLVATGDIVDGRLDHLAGLTTIFTRIRAPLGQYAVTGNHEYYAGLEQALSFLERSGFTLLRNRSATAGPLILTGVDDPAGGGPNVERRVLAATDPNRFILLLKHRPRVDTKAAEHFDLQLSGHAHRGQIAPFNLVTALEYPLQNGLYQLASGSLLYTSRGTGTWGPPIRVFSPPEITLIELAPTSSAPP